MKFVRRALLPFLATGALLFCGESGAQALRAPSTLHASVSVRAPSASLEVGYFYNQLSPYGRWIDHRDYGWVWTPRSVHTGWRPYSYGRWVESDYGWTWASEEAFGWATYHYGRWAFDPNDGWIWLPGTDWAPAWVSWQEGDGYIGWAPLPPSVGFSSSVGLQLGGLDLSIALAPSAYVFVPERVFLETRLSRYVVPVSRNVTLCRGSRNVTRYSYSNNRLINTGLEVDRIERVTHRRVERLRIAEVNSRTAAGLHGRDLRVFRPAREQLRTVRVAERNNAGFTPADRGARRPEKNANPAPPARRAEDQIQATRKPLLTNQRPAPEAAAQAREKQQRAAALKAATERKQRDAQQKVASERQQKAGQQRIAKERQQQAAQQRNAEEQKRRREAQDRTARNDRAGAQAKVQANQQDNARRQAERDRQAKAARQNAQNQERPKARPGSATPRPPEVKRPKAAPPEARRGPGAPGRANPPQKKGQPRNNHPNGGNPPPGH